MPKNISKQLLLQYMEGKCTFQEKLEVEEFLKQPDSEALFNEALDMYWLIVKNEQPAEPTPEAYSKFKNRYSLYDNYTPKSRFSPNRYLQYAAALILCLSVCAYFLKSGTVNNNTVAYIQKYNPRGQRSVVFLPDGSKVYLGADSHLKFKQEFNDATRDVTFDGEGFFEIKHKNSQPFIIHTGNVSTIVLGTSFKVEAFRKNIINVIVATGKVSVGSTLGRSYRPIAVLSAGQSVSYNAQTNLAREDRINVSDLNVWINGGMTFRNMSLSEICERLERWYNVKIIVQKGLENFMMSASFENVSIDEMLAVLTRTAGMSYIKNGTIIHLNKRRMNK